MKEYNVDLVTKYIEENSDKIDSAALGMKEDWFWTAETIYKDGGFKKLPQNGKFIIGGISGSRWATPTMEVIFKDGSEKFFNAYVGGESGECPDFFSYGCLSSEVQNRVSRKLNEKI